MINIGDIVQFKEPNAYRMIVVKKRRMFASNIYAYTVVKYPNGEIAEYDETQLVKF